MHGQLHRWARTGATSLLAALLLAGAPAAAGVGPTARETRDNPASPAAPQVILWDQTTTPHPSSYAISSNYDPIFDGLDSIAADDFENASSGVWDITQVAVIGAYLGPGASVVDSVLVQIYTDSGAARPGVLVHQQTVPAASVGNLVTGEFVLPLTPALKVVPGVYWLAAQANKEYSQSGREWVWRESTALRLSPSVWRQPGNAQGSNCFDFLPRIAVCQQPRGSTNPDLVFRVDGNTGGTNPLPVLSQLSPASRAPGTADFTLTLQGANFVGGATAVWNGLELPAASVTGNRLTVNVPGSLIATAGSATLSVRNPAPGGGDSNTLTFSIAARMYLPAIRR
jgi:hypothetical protein